MRQINNTRRDDMKMRYILFSLIVLALVSAIAQPALAQREGDPMFRIGQLVFTSQPPLVGRAGVPYVYTAQARSKDSTAIIRYMSDWMNPQGFKIDSVSGKVAWTPATRGWYKISILARSNKGELGMQGFMVAVTAGNGIVQGKVTDTAGTGIAGVAIEVLQAITTQPAYSACYSYATKTDKYGNYRISNIDPGKYKLHAVSPTPLYASQWFDGKSSAFDADVVTVVDSTSATSYLTANFVLRAGIIRLPLVVVTGTVKDTAAKAIKGADVFFVRSGFALNSNSSVEDFRNMFELEGPALDFRMEGTSPHVFHVKTDSLGKYAAKLLPGIYIGYARAIGFAVEFYNEQSELLKATPISLSKDTSGINFSLAKLPPVALGIIKGMVMDTAKAIGVRARIIAMRDRWLATDPYAKARSYVTDTDSLGVYTLTDLLPGSYFVLALPVGNYAPAFYSTDTTGIWWRRATRVVINGNTATDIDIYVREMPRSLHGFTAILGKIRINGVTTANAAGALVYAKRNSDIAGFSIADGAGQYEISGLAPGTYTVTADLPGYDSPESKAATVSYNSLTGAPVTASVDLNLSVTTDVSDPSAALPQSFVLSQNYPNPFNPSTAINFQLSAAGNVDLRVYDMLGREVAVLVTGVQSPGSHTVQFDASALATGVYMYRLSAGTMTATMKMLLLK
jgi:hypothetical protein